MNNQETSKFARDYLETKIVENAVITETIHKRGGHCFCVRTPHVSLLCGEHIEWSLPQTVMIWNIQSKEAIKKTLDRFVDGRHFAK